MLQPTRLSNHEDTLRGRIFPALVVSNSDEKMQGRIKFRCPELHRDHADTDLPYALQMQAGYGNGASGVINVPAIGTWVWVMFTDDEGYHAFYLGGANLPHTVPAELKTNYPNIWGWVDRFNNLWKIDFVTGQINLTHKSGTIVNIDGAGNLTITSSNADINVNGNAKIAASGTVNVLGSSGVNINGSTINLNSGSAPSVAAKQPRASIASVNAAGKTGL